MNLFDAVCHASRLLRSAGFSTHDQSFQYFDLYVHKACGHFFHGSVWSQFCSSFLCIKKEKSVSLPCGCRSKNLLFGPSASQFISGRSFPISSKQFRCRLYRSFISGRLLCHHNRVCFVRTISVATYSAGGLILAAFAGGCAGLYSGGIKIIRVLTIWRQGAREIKRLVHQRRFSRQSGWSAR